MKACIIILVIVFGFMSFAWGDPPVRQVEVVNDYLKVDVSQPVDVNVIGEPFITGNVQIINTASNPIPVVYVNNQVCEKEHFTAYTDLPALSTTEILQIPQGRRALITDIVFNQPFRFNLLVGGKVLFIFSPASDDRVINLTSGFITDPGPTTIEATAWTNAMELTIAGYFISE